MKHRKPALRCFALRPGELAVDNFAGGGGASTGIEAAIGRPVDLAINHSQAAIAMHKANHPETRHFCEDIWAVDPATACSGKPVGIAWFSPDCTHFSRAKGTAPLKKEIRGLAWVVINWARAVRPRVIVLENVEEFQTWGPLGADNRPDPTQAGSTFADWLAQLSALGYRAEYRTLVAADYGTPTIRRRLFLIARCDGGPIVWPAASHGEHRTPWVPAAKVIDWSLPVSSIFGRKRELALATLRRIASGVQRYVIGNSRPFLLPLTHQRDSRTYSVDEPVRTITGAHRGEFAVCQPFIVRHGHYSTITGAGLRDGCGAGTFRGQQLSDPLGTVCATNDKHLVAPIILKHYGGMVGHGVERTLGTVTGKDHHALGAAMLAPHDHSDEVRAFLIKFYGTSTGAQLQLPMPTVAGGGGHLGIVMVRGELYRIVDIGMRMLQPHELFAAQGFPDDYIITPEFNGKPMTKTLQTELCGNSVCPQVAEAIVGAQAAA